MLTVLQCPCSAEVTRGEPIYSTLAEPLSPSLVGKLFW